MYTDSSTGIATNDDEQHGHQSGSQEHQGDLAFGAARYFRVDVGAARLVGQQRRRGGLDRAASSVAVVAGRLS